MKKIALLIILLIGFNYYYSQISKTDTLNIRNEYINASASFIISNPIFGISLNLEYQKMLDLKYSYSFSYSHTLGVENLFNSGIGSATLAHADIFTINGYYRVNLWKN